jgi:hypothetical protein
MPHGLSWTLCVRHGLTAIHTEIQYTEFHKALMLFCELPAAEQQEVPEIIY